MSVVFLGMGFVPHGKSALSSDSITGESNRLIQGVKLTLNVRIVHVVSQHG